MQNGQSKKHLLLFVEQNGNDDADDEDHGQDGPDDPDQPFLSIYDGLWIWVVQLDGVGERTSSKSLEDMKRWWRRVQRWSGDWKRRAKGIPQEESLGRRRRGSLQHKAQSKSRENALCSLE